MRASTATNNGRSKFNEWTRLVDPVLYFFQCLFLSFHSFIHSFILLLLLLLLLLSEIID